MKIKQFFEPEPEGVSIDPKGFTCRGDNVLWCFLSKLDIEKDIYSTIKNRLEKYFKEFEKTGLVKDAIPPDGGGMSAGKINPTWWKEIGLPLIEKRVLE